MYTWFQNLLKSKIVESVTNYFKTSTVADGFPMLIVAGVVFYGWDKLTEYSMESIATTSIMSTLINIAIFAICLRVITRGFDKLAGISFKEWYKVADTADKSFYFGLRMAAIAIALAMIIG